MAFFAPHFLKEDWYNDKINIFAQTTRNLCPNLVQDYTDLIVQESYVFLRFDSTILRQVRESSRTHRQSKASQLQFSRLLGDEVDLGVVVDIFSSNLVDTIAPEIIIGELISLAHG